MNEMLLHVAAVVAAGYITKPGVDINNPKEVAKNIVTLAKEIIKEAKNPT